MKPVADADEAIAALEAENARLRAENHDLAEQHERDLGFLRMALVDACRVQERLDGILRSVADPLIVTDPQRQIVLLNRAAQALLEVVPDQAVGRRIEDVVADAALGRQLATALQPEKVGIKIEFPWPDRDSVRPRIYQGSTSSFCDKGGCRAGLILVMHEVTREREIERMKCEFVSRTAHELQTPLTAIIGFSELLVGPDALSEDVRQEGLTVIHERAEVLSRIVDDILDLNRVQAGRPLNLDCKTADLRALAHERVAAFRGRWDQYRFELQEDHAATQIVMDRHKMSQVLDNLLSNAVKFSSPEDPPVTVRGVRTSEGYLVSVADQGIGMSAEQVRHACEAFYCGDSPGASAGGTGLGLCLVKHIVEAHGGRVWIESALGQGTTVSLLLPVDPSLQGAADVEEG